jgi:DivIVA domain-containing protein
MALMPEDVFSKHFTATQFRRGYDEREVDEFLDEVVVQLRALSSENNDLRARLRACQEDNGVTAPQGGAAARLFRRAGNKGRRRSQR